MFTYFQVQEHPDENLTLLYLGKSVQDLAGNERGLKGLRSDSAACFKPEDKHRILATIEAAYGTTAAFDEAVARCISTLTHGGSVKRDVEM